MQVSPSESQVAAGFLGPEAVDELSTAILEARARAAIQQAVERFHGKIALISSFGADSVALLHLTVSVAPKIPVFFIDTLRHFPETLAYVEQLRELLQLNLARIAPSSEKLAQRDPRDERASYDPDGCCDLRKTEPLGEAMRGYHAWISGRKRFQNDLRANIELVELERGKVKINPFADWSAADIVRYRQRHALPQHPLVAQNYLSIGCAPCTSPVAPGEDSRAGRWRDFAKTECGIHFKGQGEAI